jgi:surface antigen
MKGRDRRVGRYGAVALALALLAPGLALISPSPAAATTRTVSGTVICPSGQAVQGVWVQSSTGGSRFATWFGFPKLTNAAYYSAPIAFSGSSTSIELRVGCGGDAAQWRATEDSKPAALGSANRVLNVSCSSPSARGYGNRDSCTWAPKGSTAGGNQGDAGFCTWGALHQWRLATGYYPNFAPADAIDFDERAQQRGYRVTRAPSRRSIVVFNTGTFGHVGWVTNVRRVSGKIYVDYIDMNGGPWVNAAEGITTDFDEFKNRTREWTAAVNWRFIQASP